jgi:hypothetical protein
VLLVEHSQFFPELPFIMHFAPFFRLQVLISIFDHPLCYCFWSLLPAVAWCALPHACKPLVLTEVVLLHNLLLKLIYCGRSRASELKACRSGISSHSGGNSHIISFGDLELRPPPPWCFGRAPLVHLIVCSLSLALLRLVLKFDPTSPCQLLDLLHHDFVVFEYEGANQFGPLGSNGHLPVRSVIHDDREARLLQFLLAPHLLGVP